MKALGLDACRGKWLAVVLDEGRFDDARLASDAAALVSEWPNAAAIGVDIPIGLPETPLREADRAAREFVGERRSSVFTTFPSVVLEAPTYEEAKAICVARGWAKPSIQSYGMRHRIFEIARLARSFRIRAAARAANRYETRRMPTVRRRVHTASDRTAATPLF